MLWCAIFVGVTIFDPTIHADGVHGPCKAVESSRLTQSQNVYHMDLIVTCRPIKSEKESDSKENKRFRT